MHHFLVPFIVASQFVSLYVAATAGAGEPLPQGWGEVMALTSMSFRWEAPNLAAYGWITLIGGFLLAVATVLLAPGGAVHLALRAIEYVSTPRSMPRLGAQDCAFIEPR